MRIDADAAVGNNGKRPAAESFIDISQSRNLDNSVVPSIKRHHTNLPECREAPVEHQLVDGNIHQRFGLTYRQVG